MVRVAPDVKQIQVLFIVFAILKLKKRHEARACKEEGPHTFVADRFRAVVKAEEIKPCTFITEGKLGQCQESYSNRAPNVWIKQGWSRGRNDKEFAAGSAGQVWLRLAPRGAGEVIQQRRALTASVEDPSAIPAPAWQLTTICDPSFKGSHTSTPSSGLQGYQKCMWYTDRQTDT